MNPMKLPRYACYILLLLLFVAAAWTRLDRAGQSESLYFKGESATNYRYSYLIGQSGRLPENDRKAAYPDGFRPARVKAMGVEFMTGYAYKVVRYFSNTTERPFIHTFTALFFSLMVFAVYGLGRALWRCQAGALFAAALVAFSVPLIAATDGSTFTHPPYAALAVAVHLLLLVRYIERPSPWKAIAAALVAFILAAFQAGALFYLVPALVLAAAATRNRFQTMFAFLLPHVIAVAAAAVVLPWFGVGDGARDWSYIFYRVRYAFGKPTDPALLPEPIRLLWTRAHAAPPAYTLVSLLLPVAVLLPAIVDGMRGIARERRTVVRAALPAAILPVLLLLFDRTMIVFAVPALALIAGTAFHSFSRRFALRAPFVALACFLLFAQIALPRSGADLTHQAADLAGIAQGDPETFTWMSVGDADLDLVTFLSSRTGTHDPFLASPEQSSFILTFAGRTTTLMPGIAGAGMLDSIHTLTHALYEDEEELYRLCTERRIAYVLYSIDMTLDDSRYSLRYLNGAVDVDNESAAFKMHFFPEDLSRFELVYENDTFRVFKVVEQARPIFLSDHPPVYQYGILLRNRDNLPSFYDRIIRLISRYALAVRAQERGEWDTAVELYQQSLAEAPRFTRARLGLGGTFLARKEWKLAKPVFLSVIGYAPDNQEALFGAAYAMYYLEEWEDARRYLNILIATPGRDRELVKRARGLRMAITEKLDAQK